MKEVWLRDVFEEVAPDVNESEVLLLLLLLLLLDDNEDELELELVGDSLKVVAVGESVVVSSSSIGRLFELLPESKSKTCSIFV